MTKHRSLSTAAAYTAAAYTAAAYTAVVIFCLLTLGCRLKTDPPTYRIGLSQCSDDAWRKKMDEEMVRELLFHENMHLSIRSANDCSEIQSLQIDSFISEGVDLLIVSPNEADGLTAAVSRAYDAGIPVIVADRRVHGNKYTAVIGGDNYTCGRLMAEYAISQLPRGGHILLLRGLEGSTPDVLRYEGLRDNLPSNIIIDSELRANWFGQEAHDMVAALLESSVPDIILSFNDPMAIGAWEAASERLTEGQPKPMIVGVDALTGKGGGVEAIAAGRLSASVNYATAGDLIIETAAQILEGRPFKRDTIIPTALIDRAAAEPMMQISKEIDKGVETITMLRNHIDLYTRQMRQERIIFMLVFVMALLVFIFFIYYLRLYRRYKQISEQLLIAQQELERATLSKLTFFTNVSHDFRTPLTLIADPVTQLAEDPTLGAEQHSLAVMAQKNSQVLLRLINQTLDLRKMESGMLRVNHSRVNMLVAMKRWTEAFMPLAAKRHIHLSLITPGHNTDSNNEKDCSCPDSPFCAALDAEKAERIVYNLIANAFKFTPENGEIEVSLAREDENIVFSISDNGSGIPDEHKKHIFESFYQVDSTNSQGSGIGLTLVKSFVDLQGGTITVSDNHPQGTRFTIILPVGNIEQAQFTLSDADYVNITSEQILTELDEQKDNILETPGTIQGPIMLCIDDNSDIRHYLKHIFSKDYTVLTAKNGTEGIKKAAISVPDIIICDVSMPDMSGVEVTEQLKSATATSHIPVIMLTAHSLDDQRIEGLEKGADAYMAKPFNQNVLKAQVKTLIDNRQRVRLSSLQTTTATANTAPAVPKERAQLMSAEEQFLQRFNTIVLNNLSDDTLSVETIASEMALSRTQLYRKIKQLTNYSPNELIRQTRLQEAQNMLLKGDKTVSEVAYLTGFTSPSYFTKCYYEFFGTRPNEVRKK